MDHDKVERLVRELLIEIGEDPDREGLLKTPHRVATALDYLTSGYRADTKRLINGAIFLQDTKLRAMNFPGAHAVKITCNEFLFLRGFRR